MLSELKYVEFDKFFHCISLVSKLEHPLRSIITSENLGLLQLVYLNICTLLKVKSFSRFFFFLSFMMIVLRNYGFKKTKDREYQKPFIK